MRRKEKSTGKKFLLIGLFVFLIAGLSIGYAALQTTLTINGTTTISKVGWDIHFEDIVETEGSEENGTAVISNDDSTEITYNVTLAAPGDFYEFTVNVKNAGTLDAKLASVENPQLTDEEAVYAIYTVEGIPAKDSVLAADDFYQVKIRVEYDPDINPDELPTEEKTLSKTIKLNYVQNR